jgi:hypothetical protein
MVFWPLWSPPLELSFSASVICLTGTGPVAGTFEYGNENYCFLKDGELPEYLSDYYLLKDFAP